MIGSWPCKFLGVELSRPRNFSFSQGTSSSLGTDPKAFERKQSMGLRCACLGCQGLWASVAKTQDKARGARSPSALPTWAHKAGEAPNFDAVGPENKRGTFHSLSASLLLWHSKMNRPILYFPCLSPGINHFCKECWFLLEESDS